MDTPAVFLPGTAEWLFDLVNGPNPNPYTFNFGSPTSDLLMPVSGDWFGLGVNCPAVYDFDTQLWMLSHFPTAYDPSPVTFTFGPPGAGGLPAAGNFFGDGLSYPAVYYPSTGRWYISHNAAGGDSSPLSFQYGFPGTYPAVGHWAGLGGGSGFPAGVDTPAVYEPSAGMWFLSHVVTGENSPVTFAFGTTSTIPIVGDFFGTGVTLPGYYTPGSGLFTLGHNPLHGDASPLTFTFGPGGSSSKVVAGHWVASPQLVIETEEAVLEILLNAGDLRTLRMSTPVSDVPNVPDSPVWAISNHTVCEFLAGSSDGVTIGVRALAAGTCTITASALVNGVPTQVSISVVVSASQAPVLALAQPNTQLQVASMEISVPLVSVAAPAPPAPLGVTAQPGNATITLQWTGSLGAASYNIYRGTSSGTESLHTSGVTGTTYTDSVSNATLYYYKVAAVNSTGTGPLSAEVTATANAGLPGAPTITLGTSLSNGIQLTYSGVGGATSYNLYRSTTPGAEVQIETGITNPYIDTTATVSGQTYYFQVTAVNGTGEGPRSAEFAVTRSLSAINTPTLAVGNGSITVSWPVVANAASYNIYRGTADPGETLYQAGLTGQPFIDTAVVPGVTYYYQIAAVSAGGVVAAPGTASEAVAMSVPTNVVAAGATGSVVLTWNSVPGAATYTINRGTSPSSLAPLTTGVGTTTYTDSAIINGTTYYYSVTPVNSLSQAGAASTATVGSTPLAAPTSVSVTTAPSAVQVSWGAVAGATGYTITRSQSSGGTNVLATGVTGTTYIDYATQPGTLYYYTVTATGLNSTSSSSSSSSGGYQPTPSNLAATTPTSGEVVLTWSPTPGASSYTVLRGTSPSGETTLASGITSPTYTDTAVSNGTTYYYEVVAVSGLGNSLDSNEVSIQPMAAPTGLGATASVVSNIPQIALSWSASTGAASYNVFRSNASGQEVLIKSGVTGTSFTDIATLLPQFSASYRRTPPPNAYSLQPGNTYYYKVQAVNTGGQSSLSSELPVSTLSAPFSVPLVTSGNGSVVLNWDAVPNATSYSIYRGTISGGETLLTSGVMATTYTDNTAVNGTVYYYQVAGAISSYVGPVSGEAAAKPLAVPVLTANIGYFNVVLTWPAVAGADSINVYRGNASGGETLLYTGLFGNATTFTDSRVNVGQTYYYKIEAINFSGSTTSNESSAAPYSTAPATPTGFSVTPGVEQNTLNWTKSSLGTGYNIYRSTTSGAETLFTTVGNVATYLDTGLTPATTYYYKITATNLAGESAKTAEESGTPTAPGGVFHLLGASSPLGICYGPDGNLWVADGGGEHVLKVSTSGTLLATYDVSSVGAPYSICVGSDNNLWFTCKTSALGKLTTSGTLTLYSTSIGAGWGICAGPDSNLWVADNTGSVWKVTTSGGTTQVLLTGMGSPTPVDVCVGADSNLWVIDSANPAIWKVTTGGAVTPYAITSGDSPARICSGPDSNLWFTGTSNSLTSCTTGGVNTSYGFIASTPFGIVSSSGFLYVVEDNGHLAKFNTTPAQVAIAALTGAGLPRFVCVDGSGNFWVTDQVNHGVWFVAGTL